MRDVPFKEITLSECVSACMCGWKSCLISGNQKWGWKARMFREVACYCMLCITDLLFLGGISLALAL